MENQNDISIDSNINSKAVDLNFDIAIVGGGMAGCSMALLLADTGLKIAMIEKNAYSQNVKQASFDDRCIALSWSSQRIFQKMGIWQQLLGKGKATVGQGEKGNEQLIQAPILEAINDIHVSDQGKFGVTRLSARQENVSALGYVVESSALGMVLIEQVKAQKNIQIFCPAQLSDVRIEEDGVSIDLIQENGTENTQLSLRASLLIAADGAKSFGHRFLDNSPIINAYGQTAVIANVETQYPHQNVAYERFTPSGPLAMLPLTQGRCSLVWTVREEQVDSVMELDDESFLSQLQQQFGYRLGQITRTGQRFAYPLSLMTLDKESVKKMSRLVFVGNAAHSIHPVAGQGFNLGLRDIAVLADLIEKNQHQHQGKFVYQQEMIGQYWDKRFPDIEKVGQITNGLIKIFSNNQFPWTPARDMGLILADNILPIKHRIAQQAMGRGILPIG